MTLQITLPPFLNVLIEASIPVIIEKSVDHGVVFDLNLGAKSGMHLYEKRRFLAGCHEV